MICIKLPLYLTGKEIFSENIKLIASDMDNTLLKKDGQLPLGFYDYLDQLIELDVKFVFASGRAMSEIRKLLGNYYNLISIISDNGAVLSNYGEIIKDNKIDKKELNKIIGFFKNVNFGVQIYSGITSIYGNKKHSLYYKDIRCYFESIIFLENLEKINEDIVKITIYNPDFKEEDKVFLEIVREFGEKFEIVLSQSFWIEFTLKGVNKGNTLLDLAQTLNINSEDIMAFGDSMNDKEMLQAVKYSYIVENAQEELKEFAKFITESNENEGVIKVIKEVIKEKKK